MKIFQKIKEPYKNLSFLIFCFVVALILTNIITAVTSYKLGGMFIKEQGQVMADCQRELNECRDNIPESTPAIRELKEGQLIEEELPSAITDEDTDSRDASRDSVYSTGQIEQMIIDTANRYGVDPVLALRVAKCESYDGLYNTCHCDKGNPMNGSCEENCVKGIGIFKITQTTFDEAWERMMIGKHKQGYEVGASLPFHIESNIEVAMFLMSKNELLRWKQSEGCWSSFVE